ncbi:MAG: DUF2959 domain-containing protein [Pseudomonadota bacterium]|nr:DUF2959 domain-containing protein [Pseudomonadota bacterium]
MPKFSAASLVLLIALFSAGCSSMQYAAMEKVGIHKRDVLVDRVEDARDAQNEAKEQFVSAYEQFAELVDYDGGDLEKNYEKLNREYQRSEKSAREIDDRIDAVESVAGALFKEWNNELGEYTDPNLRRSSKQKLDATRRQYETLIASMHDARSKIDPVLDVLRDQTLYLKHNLNARALSSLEGEVVSMERKVDDLVREMEAAIAEANRFISQMEGA